MSMSTPVFLSVMVVIAIAMIAIKYGLKMQKSIPYTPDINVYEDELNALANQIEILETKLIGYGENNESLYKITIKSSDKKQFNNFIGDL